MDRGYYYLCFNCVRTLDVVAENQTEWEAWIMALSALLPTQPEHGVNHCNFLTF